ncbi:MAG: hypothetical protein IKG97_00910 [Lachnospiraceae bacterium]|nr:hypothetical protein [Lachnospiraceae bacterium]
MTFVNERSGTALVTGVLMPKLICFRNGHFLYRNGKHSVRDICLSRELSGLTDSAEEITNLSETVLKLYLRMEKEKALRFEIPEESDLRSFLPDTHVTGMTFLNLFTKGVLKLEAPEEKDDPLAPWVLTADPVFMEAVPGAERRLGHLFRAILDFGRERFLFRLASAPQELVRTVSLEKDMTLTYEWDRRFERQYIQGEDPGDPETERERAVRLNREASLQKTLELIRSINEEAASDNKEEAPKHV